jgi:hypothetical protein
MLEQKQWRLQPSSSSVFESSGGNIKKTIFFISDVLDNINSTVAG